MVQDGLDWGKLYQDPKLAEQVVRLIPGQSGIWQSEYGRQLSRLGRKFEGADPSQRGALLASLEGLIDGLPEINVAHYDPAEQPQGPLKTNYRRIFASLTEGQSVDQVAKGAGVSEQTIARLQQGTTKPRPGTVRKIAKYLDIPLSQFYRKR